MHRSVPRSPGGCTAPSSHRSSRRCRPGSRRSGSRPGRSEQRSEDRKVHPAVLQIPNSLTGRKEVFTPIHSGRVGMYVCGVTVYDYCHLGHARFLVVFDLVRRYLRYRGYQVTYVRNITDIDDKIIKRAQENGEPIEVLTTRFIEAMNEDAAALGNEEPDFEPRATEYVRGMQDMIGLLEKRELAYRAANGDVNYAVRKFPGYGKL